ncbi:DNA-processing protein DprA [Halomonas sp. WWR20]
MTVREWLILSMLPGLGARRIATLADHLVQQQVSQPWPQGWLAGLPAEPREALRLWLEHPDRSPLQAPLEAALAWEAQSPQHHLLHPGHDVWPALLRELPDPPPVLWAKGSLEALNPPALAMVGTRRPTREGLDNAALFARQLVEAGYSVVSGLALGIDGCAHRAALDAGGASVAVLGCGVEVIYPPRHADLYRRMLAEGGLLLSEHAPLIRAHARFFPRRNRIITGLSHGVLVVEAAQKSGSLVSARLAMEQNREVFALPGSIHNPQARGCLELIRQGAALVTCLDDVLNELTPGGLVRRVDRPQPVAGPFPDTLSPWPGNGGFETTLKGSAPPGRALKEPVSSGPEDPLLALLTDMPTPLDVLIELTGRDVGGCQMHLLELELQGRVAQAPGGWVRVQAPS